MAKWVAVIGKVVLLFASLCIQASCTWAQSKSAVTEDGPDQELKEFRLGDLEARLPTMEPVPEREYFAGVLANREGRIPESIQLLKSVLPGIRTSHPDRAAVALQALADDYIKSFQYGDAAQVYDDLLTHFSGQLGPDELKGTKDDAGLARILREAPAQTVTWDGAVRLKTERNPLNSMNVDLTVNGVQGPWLLDTGANLSVVSKSFAERLGLKFLPGVTQTQAGLTGIENPLRVALLPTLPMGGATLHNVVALVLDDANLNINLGKQAYQINGIIGYPVFQALRTITFLHDGEFEAGDEARAAGTGARMYMNQLTPIIECKVEGSDLPFSFDTGASSTDLLVRYYQQFHSASKGWKRSKTMSAGAGGVVKRKIYIQPQVKIGIGDKTVTLEKVPIYTSGTGTDTNEQLYGNLGQDVVADFESFTLDFSTMTFSLGNLLPPDKANQAADMAAIVKITKAYAEVHMNKDEAAIDAVAAVMADGFYYHDRTRGVMGSKDEILASIKSKDFVTESISFKPYIVRMFGSTAIAQSVNRVNGAIGGKAFSSPFVSVDIFTKRSGRWIWVGSENDKIGDKVSDKLLCNGAICKPNQAAFVVDSSTAPALAHEAISAGGAADRAAIVSIAKDFVGMQVTKDKATFDRLSASMADDFYLYDHTAGTIDSKQEILTAMKSRLESKEDVAASFDFKPSIIRIFGSTGIAKYNPTVDGALNGKAYRKSRVIVDVFEKRNDRWIWIGAESEDVGDRVSENVLCSGTICTPNQHGFVVKR
jgi:hypothetical protein